MEMERCAILSTRRLIFDILTAKLDLASLIKGAIRKSECLNLSPAKSSRAEATRCRRMERIEPFNLSRRWLLLADFRSLLYLDSLAWASALSALMLIIWRKLAWRFLYFGPPEKEEEKGAKESDLINRNKSISQSWPVIWSIRLTSTHSDWDWDWSVLCRQRRQSLHALPSARHLSSVCCLRLWGPGRRLRRRELNKKNIFARSFLLQTVDGGQGNFCSRASAYSLILAGRIRVWHGEWVLDVSPFHFDSDRLKLVKRGSKLIWMLVMDGAAMGACRDFCFLKLLFLHYVFVTSHRLAKGCFLIESMTNRRTKMASNMTILLIEICEQASERVSERTQVNRRNGRHMLAFYFIRPASHSYLTHTHMGGSGELSRVELSWVERRAESEPNNKWW